MISAVAEYYSHLPETLGWLQNHADDDEEIASVAYVAIARYYSKHPGVLEWLMAQAESNDWYFMRSASLRAIVKHFSDDLRAFIFIKNRCEKESDYKVQATLAEVIEKHLLHHTQAIEAIFQITNVAFKQENIDILLENSKDSFQYSDRFIYMQNLLRVFVRQSRADARSIKLLNNIVIEDPDENLREWSAKLLKEIEIKRKK